MKHLRIEYIYFEKPPHSNIKMDVDRLGLHELLDRLQPAFLAVATLLPSRPGRDLAGVVRAVDGKCANFEL
jgi:hypothetical protein